MILPITTVRMDDALSEKGSDELSQSVNVGLREVFAESLIFDERFHPCDGGSIKTELGAHPTQ